MDIESSRSMQSAYGSVADFEQVDIEGNGASTSTSGDHATGMPRQDFDQFAAAAANFGMPMQAVRPLQDHTNFQAAMYQPMAMSMCPPPYYPYSYAHQGMPMPFNTAMSMNPFLGTFVDNQQPTAGVSKVSDNKKKRVLFADWQTRMLERRYKEKPTIHQAEREAFSKDVRLTPDQIKVWFQNQRYKRKRRENGKLNSSSTSSTSDHDSIRAEQSPNQVKTESPDQNRSDEDSGMFDGASPEEKPLRNPQQTAFHQPPIMPPNFAMPTAAPMPLHSYQHNYFYGMMTPQFPTPPFHYQPFGQQQQATTSPDANDESSDDGQEN